MIKSQANQLSLGIKTRHQDWSIISNHKTTKPTMVGQNQFQIRP